MKKILVIKIGAIGDVLMATPTFRALHQKDPQTKLTLLVGKWSRPIVENNPYLAEILTIDDHLLYHGNLYEKLKLSWQIIKRLRKKNFEQVIVLQRAWAYNLVSFLAGIPQRWGFKRKWEGIFLTRKYPSRYDEHEILQYLKVAGIKEEVEMTRMEIFLTEGEKNWAQNFLKAGGWQEEDVLIGLFPGGAKNPRGEMALRRWGEEKYARLISLLFKEGGFKLLLLGGKGDLGIVEEITRKVPPDRVIQAAGKTTLRQLAALISYCHAFITHDCGALHIASAFDIPTVAIFGPTTPAQTGPLNKNSVILYRKTNCSPCYHDGKFPHCSKKTCLARISPEEVKENLERIIK